MSPERRPWFCIWFPLVLLLYLIVNGGAFLAFIDHGNPTSNFRRPEEFALNVVLGSRSVLTGPWGFLVWPVLLFLVYATWRQAPFWSTQGRSAALRIGVLFIVLLLLVQALIALQRLPRAWTRIGSYWYRMPTAVPPRTVAGILHGSWSPHVPSARADLLGSPDPSLRWLALTRDRPGSLLSEFRVRRIVKEDPYIANQQAAVGWLARRGAKTITPDMLACYDRTLQPRRKAYYLMSFGTIGDRVALPRIREALRDPDGVMTVCAARGLARMEGDASIAELLSVARSKPDAWIREGVLEAVASLHSKAAVDALVPFLEDPVLRPRVIALLGECGHPHAARKLAALLEDPEAADPASIALCLIGKFPPNDHRPCVQAARDWWAAHEDDPLYR